jgi:hypothetical protein
MAGKQKTDHLKKDDPIIGQRYTVVSMVKPPKDRLVAKNIFYLNRYLVADVNQKILAQASHMVKKLQADSRKKISDMLDRLKMSTDQEDKHLYRILNDKFGDMQIDEDEFVQECHRRYTLDEEELVDAYSMYLAQNRTRLDNEFDEAEGPQISVRGFKVRGSYHEREEAEARCKYVRDTYEPAISAYVVETGSWFPVDYEADEIQDQNYMLPALNDLMGKYHEGMRAKDAFYNERKQEMASQSTSDPKTRMQELLREKRRAQTRAEIEAVRKMQDGTAQAEKEDMALREAQAERNARELLAGESKTSKSSKSKSSKSKSSKSKSEGSSTN